MEKIINPWEGMEGYFCFGCAPNNESGLKMEFYEDGDEISMDSITFRVLETPGHTPGSVCLLCGNLLFAGDTLFAGSCGRTDFPGGSWKAMLASLKRLSALPGDYTVLPGHGEASTLDQERQTNPYMKEAMAQ